MNAKVPIISDTHGLLRPAVAVRLSGSDLILHAGDVGTPEVLDALRAIAPTQAIRGNVDRGGWADILPATAQIAIAGHLVYLIHDRRDLAIDPAALGASVVICGHSHRPEHQVRDGVTWLNPGSVGPRRFSLPISMAWLSLAPGRPPAVEFETFEP